MKCSIALIVLAALAPLEVATQPVGVLGNWQDPTGAVIRIGMCGSQVCMWLVALSPTLPATTDTHNPDPSLRSRALCGLKIGAGFTLRDPGHASGGTLYDPKSGKTYHANMSAEGGNLDLRGYVGIPLFGESQTWIHPAKSATPCPGVSAGN